MKGIKFLFIAILILTFYSCAKIPKKLERPRVSVRTEINDNKELFFLKFYSEIRNENNDIALTNVKGFIKITDPLRSDKEILSIPFKIESIYPFSAEKIEAEKQFDEKAIMDVIDILNIDREAFINEKSISGIDIDDKFIDLEIESYEKIKIMKLLKEKSKGK